MLNVIYMVLSRPFGVVSSKLIVKADYNIHHGPYGQFVMITALYHTGRGGRGEGHVGHVVLAIINLSICGCRMH